MEIYIFMHEIFIYMPRFFLAWNFSTQRHVRKLPSFGTIECDNTLIDELWEHTVRLTTCCLSPLPEILGSNPALGSQEWNWFLRHFQQFRSYRDEIETRNRE